MNERREASGGRLGVASLVLAVAVVGCSATNPGEAAPTAPPVGSAPAMTELTAVTTTPSLGPELPAFHLVLIGDSVFNGVGYEAGRVIGPLRGVTVVATDWINPDLSKYATGGERAPDLLVRLRTDAKLRADIRAADAVWFDIPMGLALDVCGAPGVLSRASFEACLPTFQSRYAKDAGAIMAAIVALRPPTRAVLRVVTVWQLFLPTFRATGMIDLAVRQWQQARADVMRAAAEQGIGVVDAYVAFSGDDGLRDPRRGGEVGSDEVHLTGRGVERLVELFVASGLAPKDG